VSEGAGACFDPGGRCGCDGQTVDLFCGKGSTTEFASAPVCSSRLPAPGDQRVLVDARRAHVTHDRKAVAQISQRLDIGATQEGFTFLFSVNPLVVERLRVGIGQRTIIKDALPLDLDELRT
jgi:hypothetical protein